MKLAGVALLAALILPSCRDETATRRSQEAQAELFLLTALPLLWSEEFGLQQPGSPAIEAIEEKYRITPVDLPSQLPEGGLLLAAQPRALPTEELVVLDAWVRRGGRLLLLADPMLEWPSRWPLGDPRRAPVAYPDTGLLRHWGLRLDAPDTRGPRQNGLGGRRVFTGSPGMLVRTGDGCRVQDSGLVARCVIGKGRATIVADADFLNIGTGGLDGPTEGNLPALVSQLESLSR